MRKLRILHMIFSMRTGGAENLLVDIVNQMHRYSKIYLMVINSEKDKSLIDKIDADVDIIYLERPSGSKNPMYLLKFFSFIFKINPHIIHCHNWNLIYLILPFKLFFKKKLILTLHSVKKKFKKAIRYYDTIICISKAVLKDLKNRCKDCRGFLIYNGVDFGRITKKESLEYDVFRICQVSRLDHIKKGQDILIKAFSLFLKKFPEAELHFYGEGASKKYLIKLVHELGVSDKVYFHGKIDRLELYGQLHKFSLLVQPSLYEGFGLTIIEGMAAKVPVLVSDIDGPIELIKHGKYGFYFKKGAYRDCFEKLVLIKHLYDHKREFLEKKVEEAYNYALRNYSIDYTVSHYIQIYKILYSNNKLVVSKEEL